MSNPKYLYVHNWRDHQSYRADRGMPPWIKIHRSLLRNDKWLQLSEVERIHLISIWILAADNDGRVINDASVVRRACALDSEPDLKRLISLGLLDAKNTKARRHDCVSVTTINGDLGAPEAETETETETEKKNRKKKAYKFDGQVIRLTEIDYDKWEAAYPHLSLAAELTSRDAWLRDQKPEIRKTWFVSTATHLKNLNNKSRPKSGVDKPAQSDWVETDQVNGYGETLWIDRSDPSEQYYIRTPRGGYVPI